MVISDIAEYGLPQPEYINLRKAVLYIALGLPPIDDFQEEVRGYPLAINKESEIADDYRERIKAAKHMILDLLSCGKLTAIGSHAQGEIADVWLITATDSPKVIGPVFWSGGADSNRCRLRIDWDLSFVESPEIINSDGDYIGTYHNLFIGIRFLVADLISIIPKTTCELGCPSRGTDGMKCVNDRGDIYHNPHQMNCEIADGIVGLMVRKDGGQPTKTEKKMRSGNTPYNDDAVVAIANHLLCNGIAKSKRQAATKALKQFRSEGGTPEGASDTAIECRIRIKMK